MPLTPKNRRFFFRRLTKLKSLNLNDCFKSNVFVSTIFLSLSHTHFGYDFFSGFALICELSHSLSSFFIQYYYIFFLVELLLLLLLLNWLRSFGIQ